MAAIFAWPWMDRWLPSEATSGALMRIDCIAPPSVKHRGTAAHTVSTTVQYLSTIACNDFTPAARIVPSSVNTSHGPVPEFSATADGFPTAYAVQFATVPHWLTR